MTVHVQSPTFAVQWSFFAIITIITIDYKYKTNNQVMEQPTTNLCIFLFNIELIKLTKSM